MRQRRGHFAAFLALVALAPAALAHEPPAAKSPAASPPKFVTRFLRGKVVWQAEALERRYGVKSVPEAAERVLALETTNGELHPLIEDIRGRAFRADERLRGREVELLVRQYRGSPPAQVIQIYAIKKGRKYEVDYWCDICSIPMYELKECECCQGPIVLRERLAEEGK